MVHFGHREAIEGTVPGCPMSAIVSILMMKFEASKIDWRGLPKLTLYVDSNLITMN